MTQQPTRELATWLYEWAPTLATKEGLEDQGRSSSEPPPLIEEGEAAAFAALGIWPLAEAKYGAGTFWLVMSVAWMLPPSSGNNTLRAQERRRQQLEAKVRVTTDPGAAGPPSSLMQPG